MSMTAQEILSATPKDLALLLKNPKEQKYPVALYRCAQLKEWELFKKWLPHSYLLGYGVRHLLHENRRFPLSEACEQRLTEELCQTDPDGVWLDCVAKVDKELFHQTINHLTRWENQSFSSVRWSQIVKRYSLPDEVLSNIWIALVGRGQESVTLELILNKLDGRLDFSSIRQMVSHGLVWEGVTSKEQDQKAASVINQLPLGSLLECPVNPWLEQGFLLTAMSISEHLSFSETAQEEKKFAPRSWSFVADALLHMPRFTSIEQKKEALQYVLQHYDITKLDRQKDTAFLLVNRLAGWNDDLRVWLAQEIYRKKPILITQKNLKGQSVENGFMDRLIAPSVMALYEKDKMLKVVKPLMSSKSKTKSHHEEPAPVIKKRKM